MLSAHDRNQLCLLFWSASLKADRHRERNAVLFHYGDNGAYFSNSVELGQCYGSLVCHSDASLTRVTRLPWLSQLAYIHNYATAKRCAVKRSGWNSQIIVPHVRVSGLNYFDSNCSILRYQAYQTEHPLLNSSGQIHEPWYVTDSPKKNLGSGLASWLSQDALLYNVEMELSCFVELNPPLFTLYSLLQPCDSYHSLHLQSLLVLSQ